MQSSTVRSALDPTLCGPIADDASTILADAIVSQWQQSRQPDMVVALRQHPQLLRNRSLMLNLVIEEYNTRRQRSCDLDFDEHCDRFQEFGSSIQRAIQRQLEVFCYIDEQSGLFKDLCAPTWPKVGEDFARFHVLEQLGVGASARVYLCVEADVGSRLVVIKVTPMPSFEASILGRLNHQNIIPIHSTGFVEECELYYLCMPYCGRSTLSDLVDVAFEAGCPRRDTAFAIAADRWTSGEKRLRRKEQHRFFSHLDYGTYVDGVLKVAIQIADALAHGHEQGILHGDLKPSNILLTPDERPLLLDFNLSQDYMNSPTLCGGTLPYMPPEHLKLVAGGDLHKGMRADVASDVYSYGALLYELLAGVTPVDKHYKVHDSATAAKLVLARIEQGVGPIRQYNSFVSRRLESTVLRCLAFDPCERPAAMTEIRYLLHAERRSLSAVGRRARVRPLLFSAAVGLPLVVLTGAVGHVATRPPRYLANFEKGSLLAADGEPREAAECFAAAVSNNPSFVAARFELGRMRIALGELDMAMNEFGELATGSKSDARSMAYLAYCFNLKKIHVAAIPWYERAIRNGASSAAVYNNLAASYIDASSRLPRSEQLSRADHYLRKALDPAIPSPTVQLNIVRHALAKAQSDLSYDPFRVWRQAESIVVNAPNDMFVESHVALWYHAVRSRKSVNPELDAGESVSNRELSALKRFAEIYARIRSSNEYFPYSLDLDSGEFPASRYFLEPHSQMARSLGECLE
jgi:eukaryotic-like serine/threonine-protein kinase